jgi:predicted DNA-binding transcriptional regulator AlpA
MTAITTPAPAAAPAATRRLLTIKNTGIALDCSRSTVLRLIKDEKLRVVTLSSRAVRVVAADVDALLG